jgi:hypothetical protein
VFWDSLSPPSSKVEQSKNAGNIRKRFCIGDGVGCDWFPGQAEKTDRLLDCDMPPKRGGGDGNRCKNRRHQSTAKN